MRAIRRVPLVVLLPLAFVLGVAPAFAMDRVGWQSATSRVLTLVWVMVVGAFAADQLRRRRTAP